MACAEELAADVERVATGEASRADVLRAFWSRYRERLSAAGGSALPGTTPTIADKEVLL